MTITHYPLLSAILLLMSGCCLAVIGYRSLLYEERRFSYLSQSLLLGLVMFGVVVLMSGLNVLGGQMLAMHSLHGLELFLSTMLFSTGVPLLFYLKFDPLFQQRVSSPYYVWEAFHPTRFSAFGFALVIISALIVSP